MTVRDCENCDHSGMDHHTENYGDPDEYEWCEKCGCTAYYPPSNEPLPSAAEVKGDKQ